MKKDGMKIMFARSVFARVLKQSVFSQQGKPKNKNNGILKENYMYLEKTKKNNTVTTLQQNVYSRDGLMYFLYF